MITLKDLNLFKDLFGRDPKILGLYVTDEPSVPKPTEEIKKGFYEKYRYPMPTNTEDENYYYAYRYRAEAMAKMFEKRQEAIKRFDPYLKTWGVLNFPALRTDTVGIFTNLDFPAIDCYGPHDREADSMLDLLYGATNFKGNITLCGTTSITFTPPMYPEEVGFQFYQALTHGAKAFMPWCWKHCIWDAQEDPERLVFTKKAIEELKYIFPLFKHLGKERARVTTFYPFTDFVIGRGFNRRKFVKYCTILHNIFGHLDILQESQIEKGKFLKDYNLLIIPPNIKYLSTPLIEMLKEYVKGGGTLIGTSPFPIRNEIRGTNTTLMEVFSARFSLQGNILPLKAKVIETDKEGRPQITFYKYGKGKGILLSSYSEELLKKATRDIDTLVCKSFEPDVCGSLFTDKAKKTYYFASVNHKREEKKAEFLLNLSKKDYSIIDLVSGEKIDYRYKDNLLSFSLRFSPFWGRVLAILPSPPEGISLSMNKKVLSPGDTLVYQIISPQNYSLPIDIKVIDSKGKDRSNEYGGVHVIKGGLYEKRIRLADNDPQGTYIIEVIEKVSKKKKRTEFEIR